MSQTGNAALASQGHENALPSPSLSSSELPEDLQEPPNTPIAHLEVIRRVLSANRAKKNSKLTIGNFAELFASIDGLEVAIGNGDAVERALKTFKVELLAELKTIAPAAPAAARSYSSAAATPPSAPSPTPTRPPAAARPAKTSELTVIVDKSSDVLTLPLAEIKAKVEGAIASTGEDKLKGITLRGVKQGGLPTQTVGRVVGPACREEQ
ncbi:hypothetical protein C8R46DRAFT_1049699 [Mycena filopes]|nr:hypothetical protein C8R46DRAFT_1049699 [Mycena filopes]